MDSNDYQKSEIELFRDARVAELALHIQPSMAATKKDFKRKRTRKQQIGVQMPTCKNTRGGGNQSRSEIDLEGGKINDEASVSEETSDSSSQEEGSADEQFEENVRVLGETSHSGYKHKKQIVCAPPSAHGGLGSQASHPSAHGGFGSQVSQPNSSGQWQWQPNPSGQWQWQWVVSQPMPPPPPPPPTQPPQWFFVSSEILPYSPSWQGPQSDSVERSIRRKKQKEFEKKSIARTAIGLKPSEVHVTENGEIDTGSPGKNAWDQSVRAYVPLILDMSVIEWKQHKPHTLQKLRDTLDSEFEYLGHPLSNKGFRTAVKKFLKCERSRLKKIFLEKKLQKVEDNEEEDNDCPMHIDVNQWKQLKIYWSQSEQIQKSEMMSNVRKQVQNMSKGGRRGKAGEVAAVMKDKERNIGLTEITDGAQSSQAGRSSVVSPVSPGVYVRQEEFDQFRLEVLESTNRNTKALETLEATIMKFLPKDKDTIVEGAREVVEGILGSQNGDICSDAYDIDFTFPSLELERCPQSTLEDDYSGKMQKETPNITVEDKPTEKPINESREEILNKPVEDKPTEKPINESREEILNKPVEEPTCETETVEDKPENEAHKAHDETQIIAAEELKNTVVNNEVFPKDDTVALHDGPTVVYEFVRKPNDVEDAEVVKQFKKLGEGGYFSMQLRRSSDQQKLPIVEEAKMKVQRTEEAKAKVVVTEEAKVQPTPKTKAKKQPRPKVLKDKFSIGQRVSLLNPARPKEVVAAGTVTSVGGGPGPQQYHGKPLPLGWYRLDVEQAPGGFTNLMHPNPVADELQLKDVVGGNTIWDPVYMIPIVRCVGKPPLVRRGKIVA